MSEFVNIRYISGIPGLLKKIGCKLIIDDNNIKVSRFGKIKANIQIKDIIQVGAKKETDFIPSEMKDKTVIGRALAGGLLLGPFGALFGGMSGIGEKTKKQAKTSNNWFVLIAFQSKGVQNIANFQVDALIFKERVANKIVNEIVTKRQTAILKINNMAKNRSMENLITTLGYLKDSKSNTKKLENSAKRNETLNRDKFRELKILFDDGLINGEEYREKKKDLLSRL